jgi:hypothetical protein
MKVTIKVAVLLGTAAMLLSPAAALAERPTDAPVHPTHPEHPAHPANSTPGPKAPLPQQAKAYGVYCRDANASKEHVKGEKGTEFSRCVTAMAKVANGESAKAACHSTASKEHKAGEKGTEFSQCIKAANELRKDQSAS